MKKFLKIGIFVLIFFCLMVVYYKYSISAKTNPESKEEISITVKKGENAAEISDKLAEKDLISSAFIFKMYLKLNNLDQNILPGRFLLTQSMNIPEIVTVLSDPSKSEAVITIQEGLRIRDIDQKLTELELIQENDFINAVKNFDGWQYYDFLDKETLSKLDLPLEGYLYPDTYFLNPGDFEPQDLIYLALDNFEQKTAELLPQIKKHSIQEIIIMASIIENEVFGKNDRKIVSGILWKRLENSWPLGADATLLYLKTDRKITTADLEKESPYNTRKNLGLPLGPISNPSLESIEAAMFPESSDYWFYLTTPDTGEVIYAVSNEEHNRNRTKHL